MSFWQEMEDRTIQQQRRQAELPVCLVTLANGATYQTTNLDTIKKIVRLIQDEMWSRPARMM